MGDKSGDSRRNDLMQFTSFSDFIAMGGHGFYVWLSYSVSAVLFFVLIYLSKLKDKQSWCISAHFQIMTLLKTKDANHEKKKH